MLFNSIEFAYFLPIVFLLYWFVANKSARSQNILLLLASYYFYSCWDWRFLFLLLFSTFLDYYTGLKMFDAKSQKSKKNWFWLSIIVNLGFLAVFKYYNFFADSFAASLAQLGIHVDPWTISVILPVGISFYTFHGVSYVIDIYKDRVKPEKNFIDYAVFVSFFPLLVAGPIERATHLLPQMIKPRKFNYAEIINGMRQILWGLFKKIVIADNAAIFANDIFNNYTDYHGSTLFLGAVFFSLQIYGDFSGYSDIALGTARMFGINLLRNFRTPYFSRDIAEFWRRWHISLSSWFRDYVYYPLGGSHGSKWQSIRNIFIIFVISGFWHGANWTFVLWGLLNALFFLPLLLLNKNREHTEIVAKGKMLPTVKEVIQMGITYVLVVIAWIFFRADSVTVAFDYIKKIFSTSLFKSPIKDLWAINTGMVIIYLTVAVFAMVLIEWFQREKEHPLYFEPTHNKRYVRWICYYLLIIACLVMNGAQQEFIYFQF